MKFVFLFNGGPLDGNTFHFDPDRLQPLDSEFGGKAWLDTMGGTLGRQFTVMNPDTPPDPNGSLKEFRQHVYEVTDHASKAGKIVVSAKHVCALGERNTPEYAKKFADFIRLLAESPEQAVMIHHPQVLGDNYEEIIESLNRLADAKKQLVIVPRPERS